MDNLNQIEIQNIRHICGHACTLTEKINYYKTITTDENIIQVLNSINTECSDLKNELSNLL